MRKLLFILVVAVSLSGVAGAMEPVRVGAGTMKLGGLLQTGISNSVNTNSSFRLWTTRLVLSGEVLPDRIFYKLSGDLAKTLPVTAGTPTDIVPPYSGTAESMLLDAKIEARYIPFTSIIVGRYRPAWGIHTGRISDAKNDFVEKPYVESSIGIERQLGATLSVAVKPLKVNVGIFNGSDDRADFSDNNGGKEGLVSVDFDLLPNLTLLGFSWFAEDSRKNYGLGVDFNNEFDLMELVIRGEFISQKWNSVDTTGYFAEAGVKVLDLFMPKFRYDYVYSKVAGVDSVKENWITLGANLFLSDFNSLLRFDYTAKENMLSSANIDKVFAVQFQVSI